MNQAELSGFVIPLVQSYLANTGNLTGSFYPLRQNPSGYVISGAFISNTDLDSAITQALAYVAETYYPLSNPAGYTSGASGTVIWTGNVSGVVYVTGNQTISGIKSFAGIIAPQTISGNGKMVDSNGEQILSWATSELLHGGTATVNWKTQLLTDFTDITSLDWNNRRQYDYNGHKSIEWENRKMYLYDGGGAFTKNSLDWQNGLTKDINEATSINWMNRQLVDSSGRAAVDWENKTITGLWNLNGPVFVNNGFFNAGGLIKFGYGTGDSQPSYISSSFISLFGNALTINAEEATMYYNGYTPILGWGYDNSLLRGPNGSNAMDYEHRQLFDTGSNLTLDWDKKVLTGFWQGQSADFKSLSVNGVAVSTSGGGGGTGSLSGAVMTTGNQTISGIKTFVNNTTFSGDVSLTGGTGFFARGLRITSGDLNVSGLRNFGTGILPSGSTGVLGLGIVYGSIGDYFNDGHTYYYKVYSYKTYQGQKVFSTGFRSGQVTDDGASSDNFYIQLNWSADPSAEGYRVLVDNDQDFWNFRFYYDTTNTFMQDGTVSYGFGDATSFLPSILKASARDGRVDIFGNLNVTGDSTFSGSLKVSGNNVATGGPYQNLSTTVATTGNQTITGVKSFNSPITATGINTPSGTNGFVATFWGWNVSGLSVNTLCPSGVASPISVDVANRALKNSSGVTTLDWQNRSFSGIWNAPSGLTVSGVYVTTGGPYYSDTNPSGFITSGQTGQFITSGKAVMLTGNQNISGNKNFAGTTIFSGITNQIGTGFYSQGLQINSGYLNVSGLRNLNGIAPNTPTGTASATVVYDPSIGDYWNDGITFNYRIYSFKNYLGAKIFSTGFLTATVTDNGLSNTNEYVQISWPSMTGVDGYRVLLDNDSVGFNFQYYNDVNTNTSVDGYTGYFFGDATSFLPSILKASARDGRVDVMGDFNMTGNFNVASGTLKISGQNVLTGSSASFVTTGQTGSFITGTQTSGSTIFNNQYVALEKTTTSGVNWNISNVQYYGMVTGIQTLTFTNPISGGRYILILKQPASGTGATVNWPTGVLWGGGTAPTLTTTTGKVDLISFIYDGINSKYYGNSSLNF